MTESSSSKPRRLRRTSFQGVTIREVQLTPEERRISDERLRIARGRMTPGVERKPAT